MTRESLMENDNSISDVGILLKGHQQQEKLTCAPVSVVL